MKAPSIRLPELPRWVAPLYYIAMVAIAAVGLLATDGFFTHAIDAFLLALVALWIYPQAIRFIHRHDFYIYRLDWSGAYEHSTRESLEFLIAAAKGHPCAREGETTLILVVHEDKKRLDNVFGKDHEIVMTVAKTQDTAEALSIIELAFKQKRIRGIDPAILRMLSPEQKDKVNALQVIYG